MQLNGKVLYLVWKGYQRRAEVLAPLLGADLVVLPHSFRSRALRPVDYFFKSVKTGMVLRRENPRLAFLQAPPHFAAWSCLRRGVPFVLDTHNAMWQSYWHRIPFSEKVVRSARAVIVHNDEIVEVVPPEFSHPNMFVVRDPICSISRQVKRESGKFLFICSFDHGEPVEVIADIISRGPEFRFVITADIKKAPREVQNRLRTSPNLELTGYLDVDAYHELLCSAEGVIVLEEQEAVQPSGACEALSSDTPLIVTRSRLTERLFGEWAHLVDNDADSIVRALGQVSQRTCSIDLSRYRRRWNAEVRQQIDEVLRGVRDSVTDS